MVPPQGEEVNDEPAQATAAASATGEMVKVTGTEGTGVTLRDKPSTTGKRLTVVPEGTRLASIGADAKADNITWRNVKTPSGASGWVAGQYVKAE